MADRVYTSIVYAIVRLSLWGFLFLVAALDGIRHRRVRSKGWQLYTLLVVSTGLFVVKNIGFLAICIQGAQYDGWATKGAYGAYIFFGDIADSFWIFLLLAISAGFCITRQGFGQHRNVVIIIPLIFLITSFVVDYVLFATSGLQAFDYKSAYASSVPPDDYPSDEDYDPALDPLVNGSPTATFVFLFCTLANFMSFFMAWFYLYDTAKAEWQSLQLAAADADQGRSGSEANGDFGQGGDQVEVGHVAIPGNAALLAEEGANASHLYGDVLIDDLDAPKSVMERIADRDKARLMKQFFFAVSIYIIMAMVVFFVPLFVPIVVQAALLIAYDALLWLFMAGLLVVFRMRESNQFLLLTDAGLGGGETTTELGVLYHDDDDGRDGRAHASRGTTSGSSNDNNARSAGNSSRRAKSKQPGNGRRVTPKFTLEDDEELSQEVNDKAAKQGVIIQSLPSPHA